MRSFLAAAFLGLATAVPAPAPSVPHVLHERRDLDIQGEPQWVRRSFVPQGRTLPVRIGLTQGNMDIAHDLAMEV